MATDRHVTGRDALQFLFLAVLMGIVAGLTTFGLMAAAFVGVTVPLLAAIGAGGLVTVLVVTRLRPARGRARPAA